LSLKMDQMLSIDANPRGRPSSAEWRSIGDAILDLTGRS
jgi:hypothetical protein